MNVTQLEVGNAAGVKFLLSGFNRAPSLGDLINQVGEEFPKESFDAVGIAVDPHLPYTECYIQVFSRKEVPSDWYFTSIAQLQQEASRKFFGMSYYDLFPAISEGAHSDEYEVHLRGRIPGMDGEAKIRSDHELPNAS